MVFETRTDREGKYSFVDVPAGNYYVYALFDTRTNYIEWLVPVQLQGRPVNIDLENSNAAVDQRTHNDGERWACVPLRRATLTGGSHE